MSRRLAALAATAYVVALGLSAQAQGGEELRTEIVRGGAMLDSLESLLGWAAPSADAETDVRVMTRSTLAFVPLPLVRLTADANGQIVASVTEWQAPGADSDPAPAARAFTFAHPPVACNGEHSLCTGTPQTMKVTEAKAMYFALLIARSCNEPPRQAPVRPLVAPEETRKLRTDAEDLFVRGRVGGVPLLFSCRGPNPKGATPGERQAAAVLRIAHHLLGR